MEWLQPLHGAATIYSIHNLAYQGIFDGNAMFVTGLGREHYNPGELEHFGALNLTKGAIQHSTLVSTVSPTYAREIQTGEYGCGLDGLLGSRSSDLVGILNGIDTDEWNPATDPHLPARFDSADGPGKAACKAALQKEAGFPVRPDVPLFGVVGRLTSQKGFDVLAHALHRILSWDAQLVLLGTGDPDAERFFAWADAHYGDRFRAWLRFDNGRAHRIEAGCRFLPHAFAVRAVRVEPDVQPALRNAAGRAGHRRTRRHGLELRRERRGRHRLHVRRPAPGLAGEHDRVGGVDLVRSPRPHSGDAAPRHGARLFVEAGRLGVPRPLPARLRAPARPRLRGLTAQRGCDRCGGEPAAANRAS